MACVLLRRSDRGHVGAGPTTERLERLHRLGGGIAVAAIVDRHVESVGRRAPARTHVRSRGFPR